MENNNMAKGRITRLMGSRGYGFITSEDGKDIFFHRIAHSRSKIRFVKRSPGEIGGSIRKLPVILDLDREGASIHHYLYLLFRYHFLGSHHLFLISLISLKGLFLLST